MVYTKEQILEKARELQCCMAQLGYDYMIAESLDPTCASNLQNILDLKFIYDIILEYTPIGYAYPNGYIETTEDQCISNTNIEYLIQPISENCGCFTDTNDLLKDI